MAKRRRSGSKPNLPKAAETIGFTEADEAFFRAGEEQATGDASDVADVGSEEPAPRSSFWRRLFLLPI
jgi:hypothetical protein